MKEEKKLPPRDRQLQSIISNNNMNAQIGEIFSLCHSYEDSEDSKKIKSNEEDMRKIIFYAKAELKRLDNLILLDDL